MQMCTPQARRAAICARAWASPGGVGCRAGAAVRACVGLLTGRCTCVCPHSRPGAPIWVQGCRAGGSAPASACRRAATCRGSRRRRSRSHRRRRRRGAACLRRWATARGSSASGATWTAEATEVAFGGGSLEHPTQWAYTQWPGLSPQEHCATRRHQARPERVQEEPNSGTAEGPPDHAAPRHEAVGVEL